MVKKTIILAILSVFLSGCNMNPNKEDRIQKLETEIQQSLEKIEDLESRVGTLETQNEQLQKKILIFEEQQTAQDE